MSAELDLGGVAVVICTFRSQTEVGAAIRSCLDSGLKESQVTVVDNGSGDGTDDLVQTRYRSVRLLRLERNLGFARANNLAAQGLPGSSLLLLNPDAVLLEGALAAMLAVLLADPTRGAVSPRIERPDGRLDPACRRQFPDPLTAFFRLSGMSRLRPGSRRFGAYNLGHLDPARSARVDSGSGACLLLRRDVWDRLQGFDEGFFMYGEDLDLCWRMREHGYSVWYEAQARVVHRKGRSSQQRALSMLVAFHISMWRFYRLHYLRGRSALWAPLVAAGITLRLLALLVLNALRHDPSVSP